MIKGGNIFGFLLAWFLSLNVNAHVISGIVTNVEKEPIRGATVFIKGTSNFTTTDRLGAFELQVEGVEVVIAIFQTGYQTIEKTIDTGGEETLRFEMEELTQELDAVVVADDEIRPLGESWLLSVAGTGIYESKKSELITLDNMVVNKAANVSRQIYAQVPGLNIWESDGAGIQLGIGGRGLNPNRTSNFNVRQNGYDIAADALGYPESYYTPPTQAIERIEIVRGAAGLQYGTQFGGMVNFRFKEAPKDTKFSVDLQQTVASFGTFNSFNSIGGTVGKFSYYGFYQYKTSEGWRPNSGLDQHNAYGAITYEFTPFVSWKVEHTHSQYLAQQPGGLTDNEFDQNPRQSKRSRNWFDVNWDLTASIWNIRLSPNVKLNNRTFFLSAHRFAVGNLGRIDRVDDPKAERNLLKGNYNNWGNEFRAIFNYPLFGLPGVLLVGNRYYKGQTDQQQGMANAGPGASFTFLNQEKPQDSDFRFPSTNVSFFAENIFNITDKLSITPGIRHEYIQTEANGYFFQRTRDLAGNILVENQEDENLSKSRSFTFFGIGASYKASKELEVYTNFSQNFRAINFNDIRVNNPSLVVDENIDDERGFNVDLGVRGNRPGHFRYDVSVFYLNYQDRIGTILKSEPDPRFNGLVDRVIRFRTNISDADIVGVEMYGEGDISKVLFPELKDLSINYFINLALIHARYRNSDENGVEGNEVELAPPVNFKTGFTTRYGRFGVSGLFSFVSEHFSDASNSSNRIPTAVEGLIPTYYVADLSLTYQWKLFKWEAGINNLTDKRYFTRRAAGYPGPGIIPSDGRSFYLTVGIKL